MIRIHQSAFDGIIKQAEGGYPEEVCGSLLSLNDGSEMVVEIQPMKNTFDGPKHNRYSIDPIELYRVDNAAAKRGLVVTGIYHSHPDSSAVPSRFDLEHSFPWYRYLIVSVVRGKFESARCWFRDINRTAFMEEPIVVQEIRI